MKFDSRDIQREQTLGSLQIHGFETRSTSLRQFI
jgi:hypothetical protein